MEKWDTRRCAKKREAAQRSAKKHEEVCNCFLWARRDPDPDNRPDGSDGFVHRLLVGQDRPVHVNDRGGDGALPFFLLLDFFSSGSIVTLFV